jgi:hypothetical protein
MPWHLTEFLLKGTYLGLLVALGLSKPSWPQIALAGSCMIGGLLLALGSVAVAKLRQGYRIKGRVIAFTLYILLDHPRRVYAGTILGLTVGLLARLFMENEVSHEMTWYLLAIAVPIVGGAGFGYGLWILRHVQSKVRSWLGLGLSAIPMIISAGLLHFYPDPDNKELQEKLGAVLLLGIPGFYLLTFAGLVEESVVEMAALCGTLGAGLALVFIGTEMVPGSTNTISTSAPPFWSCRC